VVPWAAWTARPGIRSGSEVWCRSGPLPALRRRFRDIVDRVLGPAQSATEVADYGLMTKLVGAGFGTALLPASAATGGDGLLVSLSTHRV
jgi:hypothetical protein